MSAMWNCNLIALKVPFWMGEWQEMMILGGGILPKLFPIILGFSKPEEFSESGHTSKKFIGTDDHRIIGNPISNTIFVILSWRLIQFKLKLVQYCANCETE